MTESISATAKSPGETSPTEPGLREARVGVSQKRSKPQALATSAANKKPKAPTSARRGTKTSKILQLLRRPNGASLAELMKATEWQAHSVRGFLSGAVKGKMRLKIASLKRDNGERAYRVASK